MKLGELSVNRIGFGAMRVIDNGSIWGEPSDRAKALKVLRRAAELGDMQREGKIRHIGVSNFNINQLERARKVASIVSVQNRYNLGDRSSEDVLRACEKLGIAFLPWYPLGDGAVLRIQKLKDLAKKLRATPAQLGIAWLLAKSPVMLPIPGTSSIAHLEENVAAEKLKLGDDDFRSL